MTSTFLNHKHLNVLRFGVIKYPAITARKELLKDRSGSGSKPGPVVPSLDIISRVEDEADSSTIAPQDLSMVTSTVIKSQAQDARERILSGLNITASPLFGTPGQARDKSHSRLPTGASPFATPEAAKTRHQRSVLGEDDKELSAAIEEVTSPKYLEKLHNRFGAVARERERQIIRELERKGEAEKETEEVYSEIDKRIQTHLKITQVLFQVLPFSHIFYFSIFRPLLRMRPRKKTQSSTRVNPQSFPVSHQKWKQSLRNLKEAVGR